MKQKFCLATGALLIAGVTGILSQPAGANYDEANVPVYTLPDPLVCPDGTVVTNAVGWQEKRRPELVRLFEEQVYGRAPERPRAMRFETISVVTNALGGRATRKEVAIWFTGKKDGPSMNLLLYLPNAARQPVPAFLGLSFNGNHAITSEPDVRLSDRWLVERKGGCVTNNRATDACRGSETSRWPVEKILARGYALATAYYGDLEPDFAEGWKQGVRAALSPTGANPTFPPDAWGAIGAWAWGLSRALDYLETERPVNANHVAVLGHSRLGKTALWAGARDERFAIVISNDSGEGGAALARDASANAPPISTGRFPIGFPATSKNIPAGGRFAGGPARIARLDCATTGLCRQRDRGSLGRPARGIFGGESGERFTSSLGSRAWA